MASTQAYLYRGRNARGKIVRGRVDAPSETVVLSRLRTLGLTPVSITEGTAGAGLRREITLPGMTKTVSLKDLAVMSRQMATMTAAGVTLLRTLNILVDQTANTQLAKILATIRTEVENGSSLSAAMAKHPTVLPPIMVNLVRAGETGGFLEKSLNAVANNLEAEVKLRGTVRSALAYPVIVAIIAIVAVVGMLTFIVPVFENMFTGLGGELPLPTQILLALSRSMAWLGPVLAVVAVAFSLWWRRHKNTDAVRKRIDPVKLKLPVFGPLLTKLAIARFSRNFSTMIGAGVPLMNSLAIVGQTSGNWVVETSLKRVQEAVRQGESIAAPLQKEPVFPSMVTQMIAVGEDAGALEQMLAKIADFYDQEVQSTTEQLTALIEPLMVAFIGVVLGSMIIALYLPMFSIFDLIR